MITAQESRKDSISEQQFAEREMEIRSRRDEIVAEVHKLSKRAWIQRQRLRGRTPEDHVHAEATGKLEDISEERAWCQYAIYQLTADAMAMVCEDGLVINAPYTAADVKAWCDRALGMGAGHPTLDADQLCDLVRMRQIPNAPFRERLEEILDKGERTLMDVTFSAYSHLRRIEQETGATHGAKNLVRESGGRVNAQTRIVERMLGMKTVEGKGIGLRLFITYEQGVAFTRALDMSLQEAGL